MRRVKADDQQAPDAEIWMEPHADGHRVVYALGVSGDPGLQFQGGFRRGATLADRGAVQVIEIVH
jgi:hypothetical protein